MANSRDLEPTLWLRGRQRQQSLENVIHSQVRCAAYEDTQWLRVCGRRRSQLADNLDQSVRFSSSYGTEISRWNPCGGSRSLPGGPCIHATSRDSNANFTAAFWLSLSAGSKKTTSPRGTLSEGVEIPSNTSTSFVTGGVNLASSCR